MRFGERCNLHTEDGQWNHLFIPSAIRIFPYQDRLVRIIASDDRALEASTGDGVRLVPFELERYLRSHPGTTATYSTTGALGESIRTAGPSTGSDYMHARRGATPLVASGIRRRADRSSVFLQKEHFMYIGLGTIIVIIIIVLLLRGR